MGNLQEAEELEDLKEFEDLDTHEGFEKRVQKHFGRGPQRPPDPPLDIWTISPKSLNPFF